MGLRPEQFNIKQLLRYFVSKHEYKRATIIDMLNDLTPEEKAEMNIVDGDMFSDNYANYFYYVYNTTKQEIIYGSTGLIINDKKLSGDAYYFKSFLYTYPLKYVLDLRNIPYTNMDSEDDLWQKILDSNPPLEDIPFVFNTESSGHINRISELQSDYLYSDRDALINVVLRNILNNRGIFYNEETSQMKNILTLIILNTNPEMIEQVINNEYFEGNSFYTYDYYACEAFRIVLRGRNVEIPEAIYNDPIGLYTLVEQTQVGFDSSLENRNNEKLLPNYYYDYDFLHNFILYQVLKNRGYDVNIDDDFEDLEEKLEESNPSTNEKTEVSFKTIQRDHLRLRNKVNNFMDGIFYKITDNIFVRKGKSNYLGYNYKLIITHNTGLQPVGVIINNLSNEYEEDKKKSIGDVWVEYDTENIYVYNTGEARAEFEWNIIFSNNFLPVNKLENTTNSFSNYLVKIENFDELEIHENHHYDLSEYKNLLEGRKQFIIINGTIYSLEDGVIEYIDSNGLIHFTADNILHAYEPNEVYITNIPDLDEIIDFGGISLSEDSSTIEINLYNFISRIISHRGEIIRKVTRLDERLEVKTDPLTSRQYYEINLSDFDTLDQELIIINGAVYTLYGNAIAFDTSTKILRISNLEIHPTDEIYITNVSEINYLDDVSQFDFDNKNYLNADMIFGTANYAGEEGEAYTTVYTSQGKAPALISIVTAEDDPDEDIGNVWFTIAEDNNSFNVYNSGKSKVKFRWFSLLHNQHETKNLEFTTNKPEVVNIDSNTLIYNVSLAGHPDKIDDTYAIKTGNTLSITNTKEISRYRVMSLISSYIYRHPRYLEYASDLTSNVPGYFDKVAKSYPTYMVDILNYSGKLRATQIAGTLGSNIAEEVPTMAQTSEFDNGDIIEYNYEIETYQKASKDTPFIVVGVVNKKSGFIIDTSFNRSIPISYSGLLECKVVGPVGLGDIIVAYENGLAISQTFLNTLVDENNDDIHSVPLNLSAEIMENWFAIASTIESFDVLVENLNLINVNGIFSVPNITGPIEYEINYLGEKVFTADTANKLKQLSNWLMQYKKIEKLPLCQCNLDLYGEDGRGKFDFETGICSCFVKIYEQFRDYVTCLNHIQTYQLTHEPQAYQPTNQLKSASEDLVYHFPVVDDIDPGVGEYDYANLLMNNCLCEIFVKPEHQQYIDSLNLVNIFTHGKVIGTAIEAVDGSLNTTSIIQVLKTNINPSSIFDYNKTQSPFDIDDLAEKILKYRP